MIVIKETTPEGGNLRAWLRRAKPALRALGTTVRTTMNTVVIVAPLMGAYKVHRDGNIKKSGVFLFKFAFVFQKEGMCFA